MSALDDVIEIAALHAENEQLRAKLAAADKLADAEYNLSAILKDVKNKIQTGVVVEEDSPMYVNICELIEGGDAALAAYRKASGG